MSYVIFCDAGCSNLQRSDRFRTPVTVLFRHAIDGNPVMSGTILVVDDDRDVLTAARLLLRKRFGKVLTLIPPVMDGRKAAEVAQRYLAPQG